ncbi:AraC-like ligand-binding domain-containing protein [Nesterenkonia haasae]|uniref:AraC-like ligand-binding domain-containing protein n=1 Tax=Nesterenkonia haasae TaxID=2587813 RepID=UPI0013917E55|nr:helix-turn-helix domain-containing protein [Nesterenkonia haasae]NDK31943.1 helix-turn-helix domain-containing protein [Nesterenkonia haasae]
MTHGMLEDPAKTEAVRVDTANSLGEWRVVAANRITPVRVSADEGFSGSIRSRIIGETTLSEIVASAHHVKRTPELIGRNSRPHIKLSLQLAGTGYVRQGDREAFLEDGDLAIYETSYPYTLHFPGPLRCFVMAFPAESLDIPLSLVQRVTAMCLPGDQGVGQMISPFMRHLAENLDELSGVTGARMLRSTFDLLTSFVYAHLAKGEDQREHDRQVEMRTLKLYIDDHLHAPELNATLIANAHYISVRYLQYLFSQEGQTVSTYIRARRLERCQLDLSDPAQSSFSVLQIAQRWGFSDASHFSKVFKTRFGVAPREYRSFHLSL